MQIDRLNLRILMSTRQYLLYTIGIALGGFVLVMALLIPQAQEAYATFNQIQKQKPTTEKLKQKLAALESIPNTAEYAQVEIVDKALPSKKPVLELLTSLSTVSQNTGVAIINFDLSPGLVATDAATLQKIEKSNDKGYNSLKLNLEIAGSFKQVQDFIIQVERVSPFTTVTSMNLNGELDESVATDANQQFKAKLETETYFFTKAVAVKVDTPLPIIGASERSVLGALAAFAPINVPLQTQVQGGGLDDLFKSGAADDKAALQELLNERNTGSSTEASPSASPTGNP